MSHKYWAMALVTIVGIHGIAGAPNPDTGKSIFFLTIAGIWCIAEWWK